MRCECGCCSPIGCRREPGSASFRSDCLTSVTPLRVKMRTQGKHLNLIGLYDVSTCAVCACPHAVAASMKSGNRSWYKRARSMSAPMRAVCRVDGGLVAHSHLSAPARGVLVPWCACTYEATHVCLCSENLPYEFTTERCITCYRSHSFIMTVCLDACCVAGAVHCKMFPSA
jgi:hypothetical protein